MRSSDIDQVVRNETAASAYPWSRRIFTDCLLAGYQCWVLANRQQIVAHGVMSIAIDECHLLTLCVPPACQRLGYGRRMVRLLLDCARQQHVRRCFLEVRASNTAAIALYRSLGFTPVGERKNYYPARQGRENALIMCWRLPCR